MTPEHQENRHSPKRAHKSSRVHVYNAQTEVSTRLLLIFLASGLTYSLTWRYRLNSSPSTTVTKRLVLYTSTNTVWAYAESTISMTDVPLKSTLLSLQNWEQRCAPIKASFQGFIQSRVILVSRYISCSTPREGPTRDPALPEALAPAMRACDAGFRTSSSAEVSILTASLGSVSFAERDIWPSRRSTKNARTKRLQRSTYETNGTPLVRALVVCCEAGV